MFLRIIFITLFLCSPAFAWTKSTIGSGGDYSTVSAWLAVVSGATSGDYEAELISDISDAYAITGVTAGTNLWIHSAAGHHYKITASAANMMYVNQSTNALSVLVEDIEFDANGTGADSAWYLRRLTGPFIANRCEIHNGTNYGVDIENTALANTPDLKFENVLIYDFDAEGIYVGAPSIAQEIVLRNTGVYGCLKGIFVSNTANITITFDNSWFLNNGSNDIHIQDDLPTVSLTNCVLSNAAVNGTVPDTASNNAYTKTDYASYFVDPGVDFHLLADDNTLWGIDGNAGTTPTLDLDGVTRTSGDIGPYDFVSAVGPILIPNLSGNLNQNLSGNLQ